MGKQGKGTGKGKGTSKSPRAARKPSTKQFKAEMKALKSAGITKVDLRKVKPSAYWNDRLKKFRGVINGKQVAVKVSPQQSKTAKRNGTKVVGSFAVIPNLPGQKITKSKTAPLGYKIKYPNGVQAIKLPKKRKNETLRGYLRKVEKLGGGMPGTQVSFVIHGNRSRSTFSDFGAAVAYLEDAYGDDDDNPSTFDDFQLYYLSDESEWYA